MAPFVTAVLLCGPVPSVLEFLLFLLIVGFVNVLRFTWPLLLFVVVVAKFDRLGHGRTPGVIEPAPAHARCTECTRLLRPAESTCWCCGAGRPAVGWDPA